MTIAEPAAPFATTLYRHPIELAFHAGFSARQKQMMLLVWADDSNTDEENPMLRRDPASGVSARVDEISEALILVREDAARRGTDRRAPPAPRTPRVLAAE